VAVPVRAILDTNILLTATDERRDGHERALHVINGWPAQGTTLYTSGQIIREYLSVATRPATHNGLGLTVSDALDNARAFRSRMLLLPEDAKVANRLAELLEETKSSGKQVHDANVVATMLVHGVGTVVTLNTGDFARFGRHVQVSGLPGQE
jgi:predicted nucleic acid-binding protein